MTSFNLRMYGGASLIVVAILLMLRSVAIDVKDLHDWHGISQPSIIGALFEHAIDVLLGALGGALLPTGGQKP